MLQYLTPLLSVDVLICFVIGVVGGMVIGILPGLGATLAITLATPLTYGLGAVPSLVMLTSFYTTATYGGSITAILLCTPGTPSSAATAQEGYELTKQGRGLEAIGWSTVSSLIGGIIGGIALLLLAPPLAKLSLKFSQPEYFMIAIFGLTIIASLASGNMVKGLASASIGLCVALIGMDANTAYNRYTFGNLSLSSGIQMVPAMIGLFAISQILIHGEKMVKKGGLDRNQIESGGELGTKFLPSAKEIIHQLPLILRASVLGLLIGILPGAGGDIGSWVGYNEAKRSAKDKKKFGHGAIEGVIGSESANNAVCGGAYIPLFALGIPGSGAAAVLLGALMMKGLQPGSQMFTKNAELAYPIIIGYILSNVFMCLLGVASAKWCAKIATVPLNLIIPIVVVLSTVGSYAINNNMFDVKIMLIFGLIGYVMRKSDLPTAPAVLAMILGPMAEKGLYGAYQLARGKNLIVFFAKRPLCVFFFILVVLSLFAPVLLKKLAKKNDTELDIVND